MVTIGGLNVPIEAAGSSSSRDLLLALEAIAGGSWGMAGFPRRIGGAGGVRGALQANLPK